MIDRYDTGWVLGSFGRNKKIGMVQSSESWSEISKGRDEDTLDDWMIGWCG